MVPPDTPASTASSTSDAHPVLHDPRRVVALDAVHNFRDLGGYPLGDARTLAWGRMFRADGLQRLTDGDLGIVDALGIRTVVDLRTSEEISRRGRFPLERLPVAFHHISIIDATWTETGVPHFEATERGGIDFLVWAYRDMLQTGADRFAHALHVLASPGSSPAVFHCAAGKDRTGLLAALLLGGLGVDHELIVADYGLTGAAMDRLRAWLAHTDPESLADMDARPAAMFGSHPQAMREVIAELVSDHGSIRAYLASIGVGQAVLAELADQLT